MLEGTTDHGGGSAGGSRGKGVGVEELDASVFEGHVNLVDLSEEAGELGLGSNGGTGKALGSEMLRN